MYIYIYVCTYMYSILIYIYIIFIYSPLNIINHQSSVIGFPSGHSVGSFLPRGGRTGFAQRHVDLKFDFLRKGHRLLRGRKLLGG